MKLVRSFSLLLIQYLSVLAVSACGQSGPPSDDTGENGDPQNDTGGGGNAGKTGTGAEKSDGVAGSGQSSTGSAGRAGASVGSSSSSGGGGGGSASAGRAGSPGAAAGAGGKARGAGAAGAGAGGAGAGAGAGGASSTRDGGAAVVRDGGASVGRGGAAGVGGNGTAPGAGGSPGATGEGNCTFTATSSTSSKIATVGVVEWSTDLADLKSAQVVYTLQNAASGVLNTGGAAPVDLQKAKYRTLLLGLKPSSKYTFHIEATASNGDTCKSQDYNLSTGTLSGAPTVSRTATKPTAQAKGFIITSGGVNGNTPAIVIDADGTVVWAASAPASCSRARMNYEGTEMWMMALNVSNAGGEMRRVSMDGLDSQNNVSGLSKAHHDFTVLKGGIIATLAWSGSGSDPESDLLERSPDGTIKTAFHVGSNLYAGGQSALGGGSNTYHPNAILYHESDDSYTIGDRNPNLFVKATHAGKPVWQLGGSCSKAAAPQCAAGNWTSNHGHHLLDDGTFLFFNNGAFMSSTTPSKALEYKLSESGTFAATQVKSYQSSKNSHSDSLGDVQRLPNGNTLVTFSNTGLIEEVDASWSVVQSLSLRECGYTEWRPTMYGPPER